MSWREEWPGSTADETDGDRIPPAADASEGEPQSKESKPFRVALKDSACEACDSIAALRADDGEVRTYDSRAGARESLLDGDGRDGLRFQRAARNDPTDVDAYLVWVRDPEPSPAERGPPEEGWTVDVRAQQVGAMTEALFGAYRNNPPPLRAYAARDLATDAADVLVEVNGSPSPVSPPRDRGESETTSAANHGDERWLPDFEFLVRRADGSESGGRLCKRYLAEVKHGAAGFERAQRAVMERVAERSGPGLDVLVIRADLADVPQSTDVSIRRV